MPLTYAAETALLNLLLKNIDWANVGDASGLQGSATDGSFYISLHTGSPGKSGDQTTNKISYTGYARIAVTRGTGFDVSASNGSNAAVITFGTMTGGTGGTATYVGFGSASSGAGILWGYAQISDPVGGISVVTTSTPQISANSLDFDVA